MAKQKKLPDLDWFKGRGTFLEEQDKDRDTMFEALDSYRRGEWEMPDELDEIDWVHESRDPIFAQQGDSAKHILSDVNPSISLLPYNPGGEGKDVADKHEKGLRWLLDSASRRGQATIVEEIVASAVDYSSVAGQVIYLPQQIKDVKAAGGNPKRYEAMLRRGPFAAVLHNPRMVHARYSAMGAEEVELKTEDDPHNIVDLWGEKADGLKKLMTKMKGTDVGPATLRDYTSYEYRAVWVELDGETIEIERKEWPWPFMNWVMRRGGTSLEEKEQFKYKPLLANMYHFDLYDDINRVRSLRFSDQIRTAARAWDVFQSDSRTSPDIDTSTGDVVVHIKEDEAMTPRNAKPPDPSMADLYVGLIGDVQRSGLSNILLGSEVPTGAAFSSIDLVTSSALKILRAPQMLAQNALADFLEIMLLYIHYDNSEVISYGTGKEDTGDIYLIDGADIEPKNLYISVKLEADLPTDFQARTVTGRAQIEAGINSRENVMESIGVKNVSEVVDEIDGERLDDARMQIELQNIQFTESIEMREQLRQEVMEEIMSNPELLQQIAAQAQEGQDVPAEGGGGGGEQLSDDGQPDTLIPSEANAAEGGPATEGFNAPEIRRRQQEGIA